MSYRFIKIAPINRAFLNFFYSQYADEVSGLNYNEHLNRLFKECLGWSDFFKLNLQKIGVEAEEIISNDKILQSKWALENSSAQTGFKLVIEQLKKYRPDVIMVQDVNSINGEMIGRIREEVPSVRKIIGWRCSPYSPELFKTFYAFDYFFTCSEPFYEDFKSKGIESHIMRHAFEKKILDNIKDNNYPRTDILFIGSLLSSADFHDYRISLIEDLLKSAPDFIIHTDIAIDSKTTLLMKQFLYVAFNRLTKVGINNFGPFTNLKNKLLQYNEMPKNPDFSKTLVKSIKKSLYGIDMYKASANAKINLNVHAGVAGDYAANMRLFEVTGAGSCLVTDWKKNLDSLFKLDEEVIAYKTKDECVEKIKWLLDHPKERLEIAKAGQKRTLSEHTFEQRANFMNQIIKTSL